jgi:hypothetical protein
LVFTPKLKEVRVISPVRTRDVLFKATGFKAAVGLTSRLVVLNSRKADLMALPKRLRVNPLKWKGRQKPPKVS